MKMRKIRAKEDVEYLGSIIRSDGKNRCGN